MAATAAQRAWVGNDLEFFIERDAELRTADDTEFDREVKRLRLKPRQFVNSVALRYWAMRHASRRYVPEYLLKAWGISVISTF